MLLLKIEGGSWAFPKYYRNAFWRHLGAVDAAAVAIDLGSADTQSRFWGLVVVIVVLAVIRILSN